MKLITMLDLYKRIKNYNDFPTEGVVFKDIMPILCEPENRNSLITYITSTIPDDVDVIVAPESRGLMLAFMVSKNLNKEILPLRKKGKLPGDILSYTYETEYSVDTLECQVKDLLGKKCWFIDDVYATGGTYRAAEYLVHNLGANLAGGTVLLDIFDSRPNQLVELFEEVK